MVDHKRTPSIPSSMVGREILSWSFPAAFEPFAVTHAGRQSWGGVNQCKGQNRD